MRREFKALHRCCARVKGAARPVRQPAAVMVATTQFLFNTDRPGQAKMVRKIKAGTKYIEIMLFLKKLTLKVNQSTVQKQRASFFHFNMYFGRFKIYFMPSIPLPTLLFCLDSDGRPVYQ